MISKDNFSPEHIRELQLRNHRDPLLLERTLFAFGLLEALVDNTPTGRLILQIMLSFAEFEREMIKERTAAGKAIARQKPGYKEGRP